MTDPTDPPRPRSPHQRRPPPPPGMIPDPPEVSATHGPPATDDRPWWRLQPGQRAEDGTMARKSVVHGGTCIDWPAGRHPEGWSFHSRAEAKRLLTRPDEVVACPNCMPWIRL